MKIKYLAPLIVLCLAPLINYTQLQARAHDGKIKILVLIIDCDSGNDPYAQLRKIWRSYMHLDPEHVAAYFIRGNPSLQTPCMIDGDTIWTKSKENWIPGITQKTILSMEYMLAQTGTDFDYVLRTCLSSFYIFPRLLKFLENCPRTRFYCSIIGVSSVMNIRHGGGCGFLLSPDLVKMLTSQRSEIWNSPFPDDVAIGKFFMDHAISMTPHKRMDLPTLVSWKQNKDNIPADLFQFRAKNGEGRRIPDELYIDSQLLKMFYDINIKFDL